MAEDQTSPTGSTSQDALHFRAKSIFMSALELAPGQRHAFADVACGSDEPLRAAVRKLLAADGAVVAFDGPRMKRSVPPGAVALGGPRDEPSAPPGGDADAPLPAPQIGRYRLIRKIASGGIGTVFEAEQERPHRRVALKVLRSSLASPSLMRRFAAETEILGRLEHPNIARIYEAGWHDAGLGGVPWFAMELVPDARTLTEHAQAAGLSVRQRLELFAVVCEAVLHGHQRGVVHRDLKPANILVDGAGHPRVIDFGVARAIDSDLTMASMHTRSSEIVGTLRYMSPEQCAGDSAKVDTRSDVYALGVVLCELLTGSLPYDLSGVTSVFDVPRIIRDALPRRPAALDPRLRGDLETIILKCLEKSPERRYATVGDLADDVRHHLVGEPITARRDSTLYVLGRTLARHRAATATAAAFLVLLVAAIAALSVLYGRAETDRRLAEGRAEDLRQRDYVNSIALARSAMEEGNVPGALAQLDRCDDDLKGWEWWHLRARTDDSTRIHATSPYVRVAGETGAAGLPRDLPIGYAVTRDGRTAALAGDDGAIHLWDLEAARLIRTLGRHEHPANALDFSADGTRLVSREARDRAVFRVWDVATGAVLLEATVGDTGGGAMLSPDGGRCYVADRTDLAVWDVDGKTLVTRLSGHPGVVTAMTLSGDGSMIATGAHDGVARIWDATTFQRLHAVGGNGPWVMALAFAPGERTLAIGAASGILRDYDLASRSVVRVLDRRSDGIRRVAYAPDGTLRSLARFGAIDVQDPATSDILATLHASAPLVVGSVMGRFLPGGRRLVAGGADGNLRIFDLDAPRAAFVAARHRGFVDLVAASPDGRWAASAGRDRVIKLYDLPSGRVVTEWSAHQSGRRLDALAFSPDGARLASTGADRVLRLWRLPEGAEVSVTPLQTPALAIAWSADAASLVIGRMDGTVEILDAASGRSLRSFNPGTAPPRPDEDWYRWRFPRTVAFSVGGRMLAASGHEGRVWVWTWPDLEPVGAWPAHDRTVRGLCFAPDGATLASCGEDGAVRLWRLSDGRLVHELIGHGSPTILGVRFTPDGRRLLSFGSELMLWDPTDGTPMLAITDHGGQMAGAAISGDGRCIVSGSTDTTVRLWRAMR